MPVKAPRWPDHGYDAHASCSSSLTLSPNLNAPAPVRPAGALLTYNRPTYIEYIDVKVDAKSTVGRLYVSYKREGSDTFTEILGQDGARGAGEYNEQMPVNQVITELFVYGDLSEGTNEFHIERFIPFGIKPNYPPLPRFEQAMTLNVFFNVGAFNTLEITDLYMFRLRRKMLERFR